MLRKALCAVALLCGCANSPTDSYANEPVQSTKPVSDASSSADQGAAIPDAAGPETLFDVLPDIPTYTPDAACATSVETAKTEQLPVDIIWMVDNSVSMKPAIDQVTAGLNAFAQLIASKDLDYRVIMLSYRSKTNPVTINGGTRYAVCIPPPLAGDDACGNGPRFYQSSIDLRSTQTLEQFLGTLGQTAGYTPSDERGGEPWMDQLRDSATKSIVIITDDNARLGSDSFEHFSGGQNPFNALTLPAGILEPTWNGMFDGYVFHGIYGWGSETDSGVKCTYESGGAPPSSGLTYTELVQKTSGVRAQICSVATSWQPFFEAVAQAVLTTSKLSCDLPIPTPSQGTLDPKKVNVAIVSDQTSTELEKVSDASSCDAEGGWYYDDDNAPSRVLLCPASCQYAQSQVGVGKTGQIQVMFGCETVVK